MAIAINLKSEVEALLLKQAKDRGISPEDYVEELIAASIPKSNVILDPRQRAQALLDWAKSHRHTEPLSDEAISRASMYPDLG
jgi:hypothetical protein